MNFENLNSLIIVAEIGVNHEGSKENCAKIIKLAAEVGCKYVKLQSYTTDRYASKDDKGRYERVDRFGLSIEDFISLYEYSKKLGVSMISTPLSEDWVDKLAPYCSILKIASGDLTFQPVIEKAAKSGRSIIMSTGASTVDEIDQAVSWVENIVGSDYLVERLALMHCVASYPTPINQANVLSVPFLKERYNLRVGYSNHVESYVPCISAVALGADIIEVHFTDKKEGRSFRDHSLSLNQSDLKNLISFSNEVKVSLGKKEKVVQDCEQESVNALRKGLVAAVDIKQGEIIGTKHIKFARPAHYFVSSESHKLIGKKIKNDLKSGFLFKENMF